jgi:hypothetical protein
MRGQTLVAYFVGIMALLEVSDHFVDAGGAARAPALPEGWRELPELALAGTPGPARVESRRAIGDPASGCYALTQRVSGEGARPKATRAALIAGLKRRGLEVSGDGEALTVSGLGVEGTVRTALREDGGGRLVAVSTACFYNGRQPGRCKAQCAALLERLGGGS